MLIPYALQFLTPMDASLIGWSAAMFASGGLAHGFTYNVGKLLFPDRRI